MGILWTIVIGFVIGLLARAIKPGNDAMGIIFTTLLGIAGAFIAGLIGQTMGWYAPTEAAGFIASIGGAILLLFVVDAARGKKSLV